MTQDELWLAKWQEAVDFLETYHRKPSKFIPEERNLRSWWKHNKKLFNTNRSVSLLSIVSSIEGMANLDLKIYGNGKRLGPTDRFLRYLKTYVAGMSEQKFRGFYKRRCDITHEGRLFLSDLDLYGDIQKQDEDWRLRLEILQAARLAMYNWMRRRQQDG